MWLEAGGLAGAVAVSAWAVRSPRSRVFGPAVHRGAPDRLSVALTFDDGPSESTPRLLDILDRFGAKATFFQIGCNARRLPAIAREVSRRGHEIGNHTDTHPMAFAPGFAGDVARGQMVLTEIHGSAPRLFRPPYGVRWFGLRKTQRRHQLLSVMWTVIGLDWKMPWEKVASRLISHAGPGSIFCLHDGRELAVEPDTSVTLAAVEAVLRRLRESGYQFETVSEILCPMNSRNA